MWKPLSIILISSLPFLCTLNGDFVFDDSEAIVKNKDVTSDSWINPFYNDFWGMDIKSNLSHKSYRPLTVLSFRLNYLLNGKELSATHFKITNLLLHICCCLLVWISFNQFINRCSNRSIDIPYFSTLLFAVHPVHVEAVSGIVGRADILAANAFFISFLLYIKAMSDSKWNYLYLITSVVISGISMLFKENGVTVLGFCIVYDLTVTYKNGNKPKSYKYSNLILRIALVLLTTVAYLYGRWAVMGGSKPVFKAIDNPASFADDYFTKFRTYNYIYFLNSILLIWPQWLCYDWSMGCIPLLETLQDYRNICILLFYMYGILVLRSIFLSKHETTKRINIIAVSLTIIPFLPATNILYPVGFVIAERILYIPSAGYCLLLGLSFSKLVNKKSEIICKTGRLTFLTLILIYGLRSQQRSHDWQNEYSLFVKGLDVCPLNAKVHYNVAKVADAKHQTEWALAQYKEAIRLYPDYYQAMNNLANLLKNQKKYIEAEFYLKTAVNLKLDFPAAWMNLGIVLANTKRYNEAEIAYNTALKYRKNYPDCYYNLGNLYLERNDTQSAMERWFDAINLNSKHDLAWTNLMALLDNTGQIDKALQVIPTALAELPQSPSVNFAIANIYGKINRYEDAEKYFKKAINLFHKTVQAIHYANLGVLYHRWKKYALAEEMYQRALKIDPMFKSAQRNLQSLRKVQNK